MARHVIPVDDIVPHEHSTECVCGPKVEVVDGDLVVVHNSLDGRERGEGAWEDDCEEG